MNFQKIFEAIFEEFDGVEFFLGGSRRFGYARPDSDIDVFVFIPSMIVNDVVSVAEFLADSQENGMQKVLEGLGLDIEWLGRPSRSYDMGNDYLIHTALFGQATDLVIFGASKRQVFRDLRQEHIAVEEFLNANSMVRNMAKHMETKGAVKYRAILKAMNGEYDPKE